MKKRIISLICAVGILCSLAQPNALLADSPPLSYDFDNIDDMLESLDMYITNLPPEYSLENRRVYWGDIADANLTLRRCTFAESAWGNGVNYIYTEFAETDDAAPNMRVIIYYHYDNPHHVYRKHPDEEFTVGTIEGGVYNGMPYSAATRIDENGIEFTRINLVFGELLVNVFHYGSFDEERLDVLRLTETKLVLPVAVQTAGEPQPGEDMTQYYSALFRDMREMTGLNTVQVKQIEEFRENKLAWELFPRQEKIILGEIDRHSPRLDLDTVKTVMSDNETYDDVIFEFYKIQKYPDFVGGSGVTLIYYWLDEKGSEQICVIVEQNQIFFVANSTIDTALEILKHMAGIKLLSTDEQALLDFNGNGDIDIMDALEVLKGLAGIGVAPTLFSEQLM